MKNQDPEELKKIFAAQIERGDIPWRVFGEDGAELPAQSHWEMGASEPSPVYVVWLTAAAGGRYVRCWRNNMINSWICYGPVLSGLESFVHFPNEDVMYWCPLEDYLKATTKGASDA